METPPNFYAGIVIVMNDGVTTHLVMETEAALIALLAELGAPETLH